MLWELRVVSELCFLAPLDPWAFCRKASGPLPGSQPMSRLSNWGKGSPERQLLQGYRGWGGGRHAEVTHPINMRTEH